MTTVSQMIEWLKTLPQDAEVECGVEESRCYETYMIMKPVDIELCEVFQYTSKIDRLLFPAMAGKTRVLIRGE